MKRKTKFPQLELDVEEFANKKTIEFKYIQTFSLLYYFSKFKNLLEGGAKRKYGIQNFT